MYFTRKFLPWSTAAIVPISLGILFGPSASANVYPTDIKVNGSFQGSTGKAGNNVAISFILNEPASAGTTLSVFSGSTLLRTVNFPGGGPGTFQGLNVVNWDGRAANGVAIVAGTYTFSVTAASAGFTQWTQTSSDVEPGYYVFAPRGIAVNTISNSQFYGRVYVGNAAENGAGSQAGDTQGILKANADGSLADEGQSSGGYPWPTSDPFDDAPRFMRFGDDGRVYALDESGTGIVAAFDPAITTNQIVLSTANYQDNPFTPDFVFGWGTFDVTGASTTNGRIWLGDLDDGGAGLWAWRMTNGIADPNDKRGTQVIATGNDLSVAASGGEMIDSHTNIFIGQDIESGTDDSANRVMEFTNWNGSTTLITGTKWSVGANDDNFADNYDVAIDSRANPKYVAVALQSGGLRVLNATDGSVVTDESQVLTNLDVDNDYFGVAWDAVGNLYGAGNPWRAFSPPGPNQSTTRVLGNVQLSTATVGSVVPLVTGLTVNGTSAQIFFATSPADSASVFSLLAAPGATGPFSNVPSVVTTTGTPGIFQATTSIAGSTTQFYRIVQAH